MSTMGLTDQINGKVSHKNSSPNLTFRKPNKSEMHDYYNNVKTMDKFVRATAGSGFSTISSMSSDSMSVSSRSSSFSSESGMNDLAYTPEMLIALKNGDIDTSLGSSGYVGGTEAWSRRWCIDKCGRQPGQIKCVRDACFLRNGHIAVAESKNSRVQIFSNTGKSLVCMGESSENTHIAQSFRSPVRYRKMEPTGLCELSSIDNILVVTDLNRILYIDASSHGGLQNEVIMKGKTHLHGIANTQAGKLIICEVHTYPFDNVLIISRLLD